MEPHALAPFAAWESFYVIIGSSAAALTGLQFVVIALGAEKRLGAETTTRAFGTPTIVHFSAVLLLSAMLSTPWPGLLSAAAALGVCGAAGVAYVARVVGHMRRQHDYVPVLEDWIWHVILPIAAYFGLLCGAVALTSRTAGALFVIAVTAIALLFIGIHNAWDAATYIAYRGSQTSETPSKPEP